jgi:ketosteroid isomerase-like protein
VVRNRPNFSAAQKFWEAVAFGDASQLRTILSPRIQWRSHGAGDLTGTFVGIDAVLDLLASAGDLADELRSDLIDIFVNDRGAVLRSRLEARRGSEKLSVEQLLILAIEGGRVAQVTSVSNDQIESNRFWRATPSRAGDALRSG